MRKKLLFIMDTFPLGGISKSLLALFNELGDEFNIDFLLMKQEGIFIPLIPTSVTLLPEPIEHDFRNPHPAHIVSAFYNLPISRFTKWVDYSITCTLGRIFGGLHKQVQEMDKWLGKNIAPQPKHYDAAIAYQGGRCIYYLVEGVDADVKIGYVHNDYLDSEVDYMLYASDREYFGQLNYIVTISPRCAHTLCKVFPNLTDKISVVENICSSNMIRNLSKNGNHAEDEFSGVKLYTMGRFDINQKGLDMLVEACAKLASLGVLFHWFILGDGSDRLKFEGLISKYHVGQYITLLGAKTNPYSFLSDADIYVQTSRFEGKSVALDEVKALAKPIVVTNFSTVYDQFIDGKTALICEMNPNDIAEKILTLINNPDLRAQLVENLRHEKVGNEDQVEVFKSLLQR